MSSSCAEALALLPGRPLDALEADERAFVSEHLASCAACRARSEAIERAYAGLDRPAVASKGPDLLWDRIRAEIDRPLPGAAPAAPVQVTIALVCCFCHDGVTRTEATYCASCLAPHHAECFRAHGRCSAFGCEETRTVRPGAEPPRRSRLLRVAAGLLVVGGVSGIAAFTTYRVSERRHAAELAHARADYDDLVAKIRALELRVSEPVAAVTDESLSRAELAGRIEATLERVEGLIHEKNVEGLAAAFAEVDALMDEYTKKGGERSRVDRWEKRLDEWKEIRLSIKLNVWLTLGNDLLKALATANRAGEYEAGAEAYRKLLEVVARMNQEPREEFKRNADQLSIRAEMQMDELSLGVTTLEVGYVRDRTRIEWDVSAADDERGFRTITLRADGAEAAHLTVPARALKVLVAQLEKDLGLLKKAVGDSRTMLEVSADVSWASLNGHLRCGIGLDDGGLGECGDPVGLELWVAPEGQLRGPLTLRVNAAAARRLADAIKAALEPPRRRKTKRVS